MSDVITASLVQKARDYMPGGVNSPVRSFTAVGGDPVILESAQGSRVTDVEGRAYIDYLGSWGPMIVGHTHPQVLAAVVEAAQQGFSFGATSPGEIALAEKVLSHYPSMERIRFVSSGTEAVMSAVRVARGVTGRDKLLKFEGCYHGHADALLVSAGSGALTGGVPSSAGVPMGVAEDTLVAPYNDLAAVDRLCAEHVGEIAAIIVEPIAGNMNMVLPQPGFLEGLRRVCDQHGALLIFDEVMTGYRVALGGAQSLYGVVPDLTVLGKVIGGGFPVAAFGGRAEHMSCVAPMGPVYQAGTLSGHPVSMAAGLATLSVVEQPGFYVSLSERSSQWADGMRAIATELQWPMTVTAVGGMVGMVLCDGPIASLADVKRGNTDLFTHIFQGLLARGILIPPSPYEAQFISHAHTGEDIEATLLAFREVCANLNNSDAE